MDIPYINLKDAIEKLSSNFNQSPFIFLQLFDEETVNYFKANVLVTKNLCKRFYGIRENEELVAYFSQIGNSIDVSTRVVNHLLHILDSLRKITGRPSAIIDIRSQIQSGYPLRVHEDGMWFIPDEDPMEYFIFKARLTITSKKFDCTNLHFNSPTTAFFDDPDGIYKRIFNQVKKDSPSDAQEWMKGYQKRQKLINEKCREAGLLARVLRPEPQQGAIFIPSKNLLTLGAVHSEPYDDLDGEPTGRIYIAIIPAEEKYVKQAAEQKATSM